MSNKYLFITLLVIFVAILTFPHAPAFANLVNCGQTLGPAPVGGTGVVVPCKLSDFWILLASVVRCLTAYIGIPLAVLGIGVGGFYIIIGSNSPGERTKGK